MRLTLHTDYGLRTLIFLATTSEGWIEVASIAEALQVSRPQLVKVIQALGHAGFVETRLGRSGGVRLARGPAEIRVGDVVRGLEPSLAPVVCLNPASSERCVLAPACGLVSPLQQATDAFLAVLDGFTLADCTRRSDALRALLTPRGRARAASVSGAPLRSGRTRPTRSP